jgi:curved DNA-binding protein CbpA
MDFERDYYADLGISFDASKSEIRSAYLELAKRFHPDGSGEETNEEKLKLVIAAYEVLSGETTRQQYDEARAAFNSTSYDNSGDEEAQAERSEPSDDNNSFDQEQASQNHTVHEHDVDDRASKSKGFGILVFVLTFIKLSAASLVVGWLLTVFDVTPQELLHGITSLARDVFDWSASYALLGGVFVLPIWAVLKIFKYRKSKR